MDLGGWGKRVCRGRLLWRAEDRIVLPSYLCALESESDRSLLGNEGQAVRPPWNSLDSSFRVFDAS